MTLKDCIIDEPFWKVLPLGRLQNLTLKNCIFSRRIPNDDKFARLENLTSLTIWSNLTTTGQKQLLKLNQTGRARNVPMSDILRNLQSLQNLTINGPPVFFEKPDFSKWPQNLTYLELIWTGIYDWAFLTKITKCEKLKHLNLKGNQVSFFKIPSSGSFRNNLWKLKTLEYLDLSHCGLNLKNPGINFSEFPFDFTSAMANLTFLNVSMNFLGPNLIFNNRKLSQNGNAKFDLSWTAIYVIAFAGDFKPYENDSEVDDSGDKSIVTIQGSQLICDNLDFWYILHNKTEWMKTVNPPINYMINATELYCERPRRFISKLD